MALTWSSYSSGSKITQQMQQEIKNNIQIVYDKVCYIHYVSYLDDNHQTHQNSLNSGHQNGYKQSQNQTHLVTHNNQVQSTNDNGKYDTHYPTHFSGNDTSQDGSIRGVVYSNVLNSRNSTQLSSQKTSEQTSNNITVRSSNLVGVEYDVKFNYEGSNPTSNLSGYCPENQMGVCDLKTGCEGRCYLVG